MASLSSKVAVFFGSVDKRSAGWYWTDASASQKRMAASTGPFETKEQALNDAAQSMAARRAPNDQPAMRGRSSVPSSKIIVRRAPLTSVRARSLIIRARSLLIESGAIYSWPADDPDDWVVYLVSVVTVGDDGASERT
jgi:hypothetical protein